MLSLKSVIRMLFGLVGFAASALGAWVVIIALSVLGEVRCGVTPFNLTVGSIAGPAGAVLLPLCWGASRRVRLLCFALSAGLSTLCLAWIWLLAPDCPFLSR